MSGIVIWPCPHRLKVSAWEPAAKRVGATLTSAPPSRRQTILNAGRAKMCAGGSPNLAGARRVSPYLTGGDGAAGAASTLLSPRQGERSRAGHMVGWSESFTSLSLEVRHGTDGSTDQPLRRPREPVEG